MQGFSTVVIGEFGMIEVLGEGGNNLIWNGEQQHLILHREDKDPIFFALKKVEMIYGNQIFPIIVRDIKIKFIISSIVLSMEINLNTQVKMLYKL